MNTTVKKHMEYFNEAVKSLQIADHMTYVTFPLIKERKLLLKIFEETYNSIISCIYSIISYEYLYKRSKIYEHGRDNVQIFMQNYARDYLSNEQIKKIHEILEINKRHRESAMEFVRNDKLVILSDNLKVLTLDVQGVKEYLLIAKELLMKAGLTVSSA